MFPKVFITDRESAFNQLNRDCRFKAEVYLTMIRTTTFKQMTILYYFVNNTILGVLITVSMSIQKNLHWWVNKKKREKYLTQATHCHEEVVASIENL